MEIFPSEFLQFLDENTLVEIKSGNHRTKFTEIWMIRIGKRVFARSWNKNVKGWMNDFLINNGGQIKYGEKVLNVTVKKIDKTDKINEDISNAYLNKYTQEYNIEYAKRISQIDYFDFTIEFIGL
ncbi:MAG: DUF2255 family protein [Saprospiraceae bacterium]